MRLILIAGILTALIVTVFIVRKNDEECHWVAPLKTDYVLCNDGKVREK